MIDTTSYNKARAYPVGHGYDHRDGQPSSVVVHATHGAPGSALTSEAHFLFTAPKVSAHYLVGRRGEVVEFLAPQWRAWHAGRCRLPFGNEDSIGIELHAAVIEPITPAQHAALDSLVRGLMARYRIPLANIDTHRAVALPTGRKSDPATWPQPAFLAWRATLATPAPAQPTPTHRAPVLAWVRTAPNVRSARKAVLPAGSVVVVVRVVAGEERNGDARWAELASGGYVWLPQLEAI